MEFKIIYWRMNGIVIFGLREAFFAALRYSNVGWDPDERDLDRCLRESI